MMMLVGVINAMVDSDVACAPLRCRWSDNTLAPMHNNLAMCPCCAPLTGSAADPG